MNQRLNSRVTTFSIVAFDPVSKDLGVAVQSRYFSVGSVVPWAEAGVGAIATQSFVNVSYGSQGLQLLRAGLSVNEVIKKLTGPDEARDFRQLGIIDADGNAAAFTGEKCLKWAGSKIGDNYAAQGNILAGEEVVHKMGKRFESSKEDLAGKLIAALKGGQEAGGDIRGRQSASLLVVRKEGGRFGYGDRYIDLRVEDHPTPIKELGRLLNLFRVFNLNDESEEQLMVGDLEKAVATAKKAISLNPKIDDAHITLALILLRLNQKEEAVNSLKEALQLNPNLRHMIKQLPDIGLMDHDRELFTKLNIDQ